MSGVRRQVLEPEWWMLSIPMLSNELKKMLTQSRSFTNMCWFNYPQQFGRMSSYFLISNTHTRNWIFKPNQTIDFKTLKVTYTQLLFSYNYILYRLRQHGMSKYWTGNTRGGSCKPVLLLLLRVFKETLFNTYSGLIDIELGTHSPAAQPECSLLHTHTLPSCGTSQPSGG